MPYKKRNRSSRREVQSNADGRSWNWVGLLVILLATFVVYSPALNGKFLWDDDANVTHPDLQSPAGLYRIWFEFGATQQYYPLLHTAFWIEHQLWGDRPVGYHIISLAWHLISIVLVYAIVKRLRVPGALLAAALFALHPVMVESVAWITEQKNTLSTMLYLSSMLIYLRFDESRKLSNWWAALGLFLLAILAKSAVVTLPAAMLVIFWWQRGTISWRRDLQPLIPFFVAAILMGIATCYVEWQFVGAAGEEFELAPISRLLLAGRAIWFYLGKLFWPAHLNFIYPRWEVDPSQWWQWIFPLGALGMTVELWALRSRWRAPLAAWLFFCGALLPMLPFVNQYVFMYTFVCDHFLYVASLGIIVLVSGAAGSLIDRLAKVPRRWAMVLCIGVLALLAVKSWSQAKIYLNTTALYRATISGNPDCWMAYNNLGRDLFTASQSPDVIEQRRLAKEAMEQFRRAIDIRPNYYEAQTNLGTVLSNLGQMREAFQHLHRAIELRPKAVVVHRNFGNALAKTDHLPQAIGEFQVALALRPEDPLTLNSLGASLTQIGNYVTAIEHLQHAVRVKPDYAEARSNLGNALAKSGRLDEAIEELRAATALKHDDAGIANNLGAAYLQAGRANEAIDELRRAVQLNPSAETHSNLGNALTKAGRLPEAIDELRSAVALKPDYVLALHNMGIALMQGRRFAEAIKPLQEAVRLQPNSTDAHNDLGAAFAQLGNNREAIEEFRKTVELKPDNINARRNLAILLFASGDDRGAMSQLEQALKLQPDSAAVHGSMADLFRQTGRPEKAIEHYRAALRTEPNAVEMYVNLAQSLVSANRRGEATATAKKGIAVARTLGQDTAAKQLEEWLSHQAESK
jgi:protein O-mannosyl-transferase